jgi:glutathione peroxidase
MDTLYDFEVKTIDGKTTTLAPYEGNVMLIVNVASKCGFTPQYDGLEKLNQTYGERGLVILGFPCNQFKKQEPGTEQEIQEFCRLNYGVSFPLFAKVDVNGPDAHPLYSYLKNQCPGVLGSEAIKWNFTKFLVDSSGNVLSRYAPSKQPSALEKDIIQLLPSS